MTKKPVRVTVLLPVYNGGTFLQECIQSLLDQTFPDIELLIINDGSTDSSGKQLLEIKDHRITYIENKRNQGLIKALNKGIYLARGEYIARMDADDVAMPDRIERQLAFIEKTKLDVVGTNAGIIGTSYEIIHPAEHEEIKINMLLNNCLIHPSVMFRKKNLRDNGLYYSAGAVHAEDYKLWVDAILSGLLLGNIQERLINYRQHNNQISAANNNQQKVSANYIRLAYAVCIFPDVIPGRKREYLHLLFPGMGLLEEEPSIAGKLDDLAEILLNSNRQTGFFNEALFELFINSRLSTAKTILHDSVVPR